MNYKNYVPMIKKFSGKYAKNFLMEFDEVEGYANEIFVEACNKFDSTKGAQFSTFLYIMLKTELPKRLAKNNRTRFLTDCTDEIDSFGKESLRHIQDRIALFDYIENYLSENAKTVLDYLFNHSPDTGNRHFEYSVYRHFKISLGWSRGKTHLIWQELKDWYNSFMQDLAV